MAEVPAAVDTDLTVAAVVEREGRFLMVEEYAHGEIVFNQPSGHLEQGEGPEQAVVREMLEETARGFTPRELIGMYQWHHPARGRHYLRIAFAGHCTARDPARRLDEVIVRTHWMSRDEIAARANRLRSPVVLRCIDDYLDGVRLAPGDLAAVRALPDDLQLGLEQVSRIAACL